LKSFEVGEAIISFAIPMVDALLLQFIEGKPWDEVFWHKF
jgi:hypothetical protein